MGSVFVRPKSIFNVDFTVSNQYSLATYEMIWENYVSPLNQPDLFNEMTDFLLIYFEFPMDECNKNKMNMK